MSYSRILVGLAGVLAAGSMQAESWTGQGDLGLTVSRGNTNTDNLLANLKLGRETGKWRLATDAGVLRARSDGVDTANRFGMGGKLDYFFSERSYSYGSVRYDRDDFSSFEYQAVASVGLGRRFIKTEESDLSIELGVGYRRAELSDDATESSAVLRGGLKYRRQLTETTELANDLVIESGEDNTFAKNDFGLRVKINDSLSIKAGLLTLHNSETVGSTRKTNNLTTITVGYSF